LVTNGIADASGVAVGDQTATPAATRAAPGRCQIVINTVGGALPLSPLAGRVADTQEVR